MAALPVLMAIDNIKVALDSIIQARLVCCIKHTSLLGNNYNQRFGKEPQHSWSCNIENCNKSNHFARLSHTKIHLDLCAHTIHSLKSELC